jgi:hypothetical protein
MVFSGRAEKRPGHSRLVIVVGDLPVASSTDASVDVFADLGVRGSMQTARQNEQLPR